MELILVKDCKKKDYYFFLDFFNVFYFFSGNMAPADSTFVKLPGVEPEVKIPTGKPVRTTSSVI